MNIILAGTSGANRHLAVTVVGAGPTGLLTAAELALAGVPVQVLDRLDGPDPTIKAGSINVATAETLHRRGLLPAARDAHAATARQLAAFATAIGRGPSNRVREGFAGQVNAHAATGRAFPASGHYAAMMFRPDLVDNDDPGLAAHTAVSGATLVAQSQLELLLLEHVRRLGVAVHRGVEVTGVEQDEESVTLRTSAGAITSRWVIAADGGRSVLRKLLGVGFPGTEAEITGYQAIADLDGAHVLQPGWTWTANGAYSYGPIPGRVLTVQFTGPPPDRDAVVSVAEVQASIRHVTGEPVAVTALHGRATRWTDNARQADTYRAGRVLLAGDAAHVHSPFSGQGLNLGIGDATNLGWKLAATINGWAPPNLLDSYELERRPIGAWVLDWTRGQVALMRGDAKTRLLRSVVENQLLDTPAGMTRIVALASGIAQRYPLEPGDPDGVDYDRTGPLDTGRLVGDIDLADGSQLADHFTSGRFVLLDRSADRRHADQCRPWLDRLVPMCDPGTGPSALIRPDGVVAWTSGTAHPPASLSVALTRWAGQGSGTPSDRSPDVAGRS